MYRCPPRETDKTRLSALIVAGVALLVTLSLVLWNNGLRDQVYPKNFGVVETGRVYRSGYLQPSMLRQVLADRNIATIIDLGGSEPGSPEHRAEVETAEAMGVRRYQFNLRGDGEGDPAQYAQVLRLMADEQNHPVLVHCAAGAQRTTAAVILYEHIVNGKRVAEPLRQSMKRHRHDPKDNPALLAYLVEHIEQIRRLYEAGLRQAQDNPHATKVADQG